jgi:acetylglutamate kinase
MEDDHLVERLLRDVVFLEAVGINPVLVHGGGKSISGKMREAGMAARFVNGLRVTDEGVIGLVEEVLDREINPGLVQTINDFGGHAIGFSGRDVCLGEKLPPQLDAKNGETVDLGYVGTVNTLNLEAVRACIAAEKVPVISPIARDASGHTLNVNADIAAGSIAAALGATKMIYLSDVPGIMRDVNDRESLIPSLNSEMIKKLMHQGVIAGGMIPKVDSALLALSEGVGKVHFIDGRIPHALLLEIFTNIGVGTEILP